jgi:biotin carboxylase
VGTEFVVDGVSRDGVYKVTAIWEYDKRFANGANFVYFGMRLRSSLGEREKALVAYSAEVLKALHIMQGPSHMEIIMTATGPCLVEVGSRCHGGEATWSSVAEECVGYTQIDTTLNCYLRPDRFDALPATPTRLEKQGAEVFLVSRQSGECLAWNSLLLI